MEPDSRYEDVFDELYEPDTQTEVRKRSFLSRLMRLFTGLLFLSAALVFGAFTYWQHLNTAPANFPINEPITIAPGTDVRSITQLLAEQHVVRSSAVLYYTLVLWYDPTTIKASTYRFTEPLTTSEVAQALSEGDFDTDLVRITHYEGETVAQFAKRAATVLPAFNIDAFVATATQYEGTLFPETYFVPEGYTATQTLSLLLETYEDSVAPLAEQMAINSLSEYEIIILASIIEREANTPESMRLVSGILQNRLEEGMPLQADATIAYILEEGIHELAPGELAENLKTVDNPYNTYKYAGLPPTPIGNPGLEAITAVLEPTESNYLYYLTAPDGKFYYATSYREHLINIERYLR